MLWQVRATAHSVDCKRACRVHAVRVTNWRNCGLQRWRLMHEHASAVVAVAHARQSPCPAVPVMFPCGNIMQHLCMMRTEAQCCSSLSVKMKPVLRRAGRQPYYSFLMSRKATVMSACDMCLCHSPGSASMRLHRSLHPRSGCDASCTTPRGSMFHFWCCIVLIDLHAAVMSK